MLPQRRLTRSSQDRAIAGVCAGIAEFCGWSANRVRVGYLVLSVLSAAFPGMLVYLLLWFVLPEGPREGRDFRLEDYRAQ